MMNDASSSKRSRDGSGNPLGSVTLDDVQNIVDTSLATQTKNTSSLVSKLMGDFETGLAKQSEDTSQVIRQSLSALGSRVDALEGQAQAQQTTNQHVAKQLTELAEKQTLFQEQVRIANQSVVFEGGHRK